MPEIAKLDRIIKTAERSFQKGARRKIAALVGALSFGFYSGCISNFPSIAGPLFSASISLQDWLMSDSDIEEKIKLENMYFLWKVKNMAV